MKEIAFSVPAPVLEVLDALRAAGYEAFMVGGCVRDFLRGVTPGDYDLTTSAKPEDVHRVFAGYRLIDTGLRHGTVTVLHGGMAMEITTYRVDGAYTDNRHPEDVQFTASLREDAARRDFTVNAMAYHPQTGILDYFGGMADIDARLIRAVGEPERRFQEDALRILRALRFSATLGFAIEEQTAAAALHHAERLTAISPERIQVELRKMLCGDYVAPVLLSYSAILGVCLPAWQSSIKAQEDALACLAAWLSALPKEPVLRYAAFFFFLSPGEREEVMTFLRFDNRTRTRLAKLLNHVKDDISSPAALRHLVAGVGEEDSRLLLALRQADPQKTKEEKVALQKAKELLDRLLAEGKACRTVRDLAIGGDELFALGCPPGKEMGLLLQKLLSLVLDGHLENEKNALLTYCRVEIEKGETR